MGIRRTGFRDQYPPSAYGYGMPGTVWCPSCDGEPVTCGLCGESGVVSKVTAAQYLLEHHGE